MAGAIQKTAIIILTYNNLEYNKQCIESIKKHTVKDTYEIIVVDNHSTDGTVEWLKEQKDLKVILNDYNAGFPKGCNMGIGLASEECDILLLNNDTIVTPRWLENLQACLYSDKSIGATGAVSNHHENLQGVETTANCDNLEEMIAFAGQNNISSSIRWEEKIFLIGFCLLIKREVIDKIGLLDEMYSPGYVEDNDLSLRIITAGYKLMLCHDAYIYHYLGTAFRKDLDKFLPILYANREKFRQKWGFETFVFDEVRLDLIRLIDESNPNRPMNILEVGGGLGVTLLKIKSKYPNAKLYAIEPNEDIAEITRHVAVTSTQEIGEFPLAFEEHYFDYVFIGNHLEKVASPEAFLLEIRRYLKEGGYIIGGIQNLMHYSVLGNVLKGSWLYAHDETLRKDNKTFFALSDISTLFERCGYKNPYIFHWFSIPNQEEQRFIEKLCEWSNQRSYMYNTYAFSVRFQKG